MVSTENNIIESLYLFFRIKRWYSRKRHCRTPIYRVEVHSYIDLSHFGLKYAEAVAVRLYELMTCTKYGIPRTTKPCSLIKAKNISILLPVRQLLQLFSFVLQRLDVVFNTSRQ